MTADTPSDTPLPTVLLAGPPASGKTLVRDHLEPILSAAYGGCLSLSVDEVLHAMHREGLLAGNAWVDDHGALLLRDWEGAAEVALPRLVQTRNDYVGPAIVEGPVDERWVLAHLHATDHTRQAAVIYLHASLEVRLRRNRARGSRRVSERNLRAMASHFTDGVLAEMARVSRCVLAVDTGRVSEDTVVSLCVRCVSGYLASFTRAPTVATAEPTARSPVDGAPAGSRLPSALGGARPAGDDLP